MAPSHAGEPGLALDLTAGDTFAKPAFAGASTEPETQLRPPIA